MMRFIMPLILIGISVTIFFMFVNPIYNDIGVLKVQSSSYDEALGNSKALENERDKLTTKLNAVKPEALEKLQKFLPESVDNIRLILEIEQIASPYGMVLKDVKYSATPAADQSTATKGTTNSVSASTSPSGTIQGGAVVKKTGSKDYGVWDLEFSITGTYNNFLNFTRDLEKNLRIVDISSVQFSSTGTGTGSAASSSPLSESYKYDFKIKTYWLKN